MSDQFPVLVYDSEELHFHDVMMTLGDDVMMTSFSLFSVLTFEYHLKI